MIQLGLRAGGIGQPRQGSPGDLLDFGSGQVPGIHPVLELGQGWAAYLSGRNPRDGFHGGTVVSSSKWLESGYTAEGAEQMLYWSYQKTGVANFFNWNRRADTWQELAVSATPGLNRFVKVTDRGLAELQEAQGAADTDARKSIRLSLDADVQGLYSEYQRLRSLGKRRVEAQQTRYEDLAYWHKTLYSPSFEMLESLKSEGKGTRHQQDEVRAGLSEMSQAYLRE